MLLVTTFADDEHFRLDDLHQKDLLAMQQYAERKTPGTQSSASSSGLLSVALV